jgi:hypothetical protein
MEIIVKNAEEARAALQAIREKITSELPSLYRTLGDSLVENVKRRMVTSDDGRWAPGSKWLRAKTGQNKVLLGQEKYVRFRIAGGTLKILGKGGKWTLTQHHEGFVNDLAGSGEQFDEHGRVILKIKDGNPLNLYVQMRRSGLGQQSQVFMFVPKKVGKTPARKIWPTGEETAVIGQPIATRWLERVVAESIR